MASESVKEVRVIQTRKLQCDVDEELHDAFRILAIQYKLTGRALLERLILEEVNRHNARTEQNKG